MIVFDLACLCGYQFEGWFQDHDDFHAQLDGGIVSCPECGGHHVRKIMSAVAVRTGGTSDNCDKETTPPNEEAVTAKPAVEFIDRVTNYVENSFEDVGSKLPEEALKIHYGVKEARNIRGVATPEEEKNLKNEGIELLKTPLIKKEEQKKIN